MLKRLLQPLDFLKRPRTVSVSFISPAKALEIPPYDVAFGTCERFSRSVCPGLMPMVIKPTNDGPERLLPSIEKVVIDNKITEEDFRSAAGQCLKWVHYLAPHVAAATGLECWPTIGQLWKGDIKVWGPTWDELRALVEGGLHPQHLMEGNGSGLNLHAWLTLETGELIDPTFWTSLAVFRGGPYAKQLGAIALGSEPTVFSGHRFLPMLAGAKSFELMQARSSLAFLATDRDELSNGPGVVIAF